MRERERRARREKGEDSAYTRVPDPRFNI